MAATFDTVAPRAASDVRAWALLLRGLVVEQRAVALTAKFVTDDGELVRVTFDRSAGASMRVGEHTITLPDEWLDGALTTDGRGVPS